MIGSNICKVQVNSSNFSDLHNASEAVAYAAGRVNSYNLFAVIFSTKGEGTHFIHDP